MRNRISILTIICVVLFSLILACSTTKEVEYVMQQPQAMTDADKANFIATFNNGKALYKVYCSECHNTKVKGKVIVPDFTPKQLNAYKLAWVNTEHKSNLSPETLKQDDLESIVFYLMNKKKSTVEPMHP